MLQRYLLIWLILSSGFAWVWPTLAVSLFALDESASSTDVIAEFDPFLVLAPETGAAVPRYSLSVIIAATMFSIGTLLPRDEVRQVARRWQTVLGGTLVQYTAMPLLAVGLATLFNLPRELFIGVVLVGCVPGAMASNVLTLAARGNVSYSVSLTTLATLLSPIIVPLALRLALRTQASIDAAGISLQLLREVVGPVLAGHLICRRWESAALVLRRVAGPVANLAILWIIATVVALNRDRLQQTSAALLMVLLVLNLGGYLAGYSGGSMFRLPGGMRRALTLEVGMQNAGVGTYLALTWFSESPTSAIPSAVYTFGCMLTGTILAQCFASQDAVDISPAKSKSRDIVAPSDTNGLPDA